MWVNYKTFIKAAAIKIIVLSIIHFKITTSKMSGNIIDGKTSTIIDFPHSAYLSIGCNDSRREGFIGCGSSIVNQNILLTAAHCIFGCKTYTFAIAFVGHEIKEKGTPRNIHSFKLHEEFGEGYLSNDIALVLLKDELKFSQTVRRVVLMKKPPRKTGATVAGWGQLDEMSAYMAKVLQHTHQHVLPKSTCQFILENPDGTLCAERRAGSGIPSNADSGSALVVLKFIQIGLVSYKNPSFSKTVTVYTKISYFYDWIVNNSANMYCKLLNNMTNHYIMDITPET